MSEAIHAWPYHCQCREIHGVCRLMAKLYDKVDRGILDAIIFDEPNRDNSIEVRL